MLGHISERQILISSAIQHSRQDRPQADATHAAAMGPAPLGPRAMVFG